MNAAEKKQAVIEELENQGLSFEELKEEIKSDLDIFDLICHIAWDAPALTRRERAENVRKRNYWTKYGDKARAVLKALLDKYAENRSILPQSGNWKRKSIGRRNKHRVAKRKIYCYSLD